MPILVLTLLTDGPIIIQNSIRDKSKIENILIEEAKKLDLNSENILIAFGKASNETAEVGITKDKKYRIILDGTKTIGAIRHELYHIYDGAVYEHHSLFPLLFDEIQANLYANTGLKTSIK